MCHLFQCVRFFGLCQRCLFCFYFYIPFVQLRVFFSLPNPFCEIDTAAFRNSLKQICAHMYQSAGFQLRVVDVNCECIYFIIYFCCKVTIECYSMDKGKKNTIINMINGHPFSHQPKIIISRQFIDLVFLEYNIFTEPKQSIKRLR